MKTGYAVGGMIASALVGAAAGYFVSRKALEKRYDEKLEQELEATRKHHAILYKDAPEFASPEAVLEARQRRVPGATLTPVDRLIAERGRGNEVSTEVLERTLGGLRYGQLKGETILRDPHIITEDEAMQSDYQTVSLIYWSEDQAISQEDGLPMENEQMTFGKVKVVDQFIENEKLDILYIRNPKLQLIYEIHRDEGSWGDAFGMNDKD